MSSSTSTAHAISPDSDRHWSDPGAWPSAPGIHRIPLPLPMDGLKAVNVYAIETDDGMVLIDGGWAIAEARELLDSSLRSIGSGFGDLRGFLVTHSHRDHYTMAAVLGTELGVDVTMGRGEKPALDLLLGGDFGDPFGDALREAGAAEVAATWGRFRDGAEAPDLALWRHPDVWIDGDRAVPVGARTLQAVQTPGHTPGHVVYADPAAGLLFAGDHVLPTITPSIGFTAPMVDSALGDFLASLAKVRAMPDLQLLPAHGPVAPSVHARVDELVAHHEARLTAMAALLGPASGGGTTASEVAGGVGWTRHERTLAELDSFNQGMATMETRAHLELLVARGEATSETVDGVRRYRTV